MGAQVARAVGRANVLRRGKDSGPGVLALAQSPPQAGGRVARPRSAPVGAAAAAAAAAPTFLPWKAP
jgi:hypothetical protein